MVGTVKPSGGRVGKMLEMLEKGGWDEVEREVKEREGREEQSPRHGDVASAPSPRANGGATPAQPKPLTTHTSAPSPRGPAPVAKKSEANGAVKSHGLKPERRILAYGLGAVQGKRSSLLLFIVCVCVCVCVACLSCETLTRAARSRSITQTDDGGRARSLSRAPPEPARRFLRRLRRPRRCAAPLSISAHAHASTRS
jgi:hypothetical protein